ncbi:hypothetical protein, partial [Paraburkholderia oxyphila]|uniref:hypothetical protein n=1 Tax=Paraburkholderia oxyphila TaxID=614212 RepID=UPI001C3F1AEC
KCQGKASTPKNRQSQYQTAKKKAPAHGGQIFATGVVCRNSRADLHILSRTLPLSRCPKP